MSADTRQAMRTIAAHALNAADCRELLDMLDLLPAEPKRMGRPPVERGHGDYRTYRKGCRCHACREDHRRQSSEDRRRRAANPAGADQAGHGNPSTYKNHGCRCAACTKAQAANFKAYKDRRRASAVLAETGGAL